MAETADGWVLKSATKDTNTSSNMQSIDVEANTDTSQLLLKELEHVISLVGPAKEEITHLQQEFTKHQVTSKMTSSENIDEMHCQLDSAKRECANLQKQLMQEKVKTEAQYTDKLGELQIAYTKIRELEVMTNSVKDREDKMRTCHKEEIDAYKDVNHNNEKLLQAALKQVKEKEERERQMERAYTNDIKKLQQEITKLTALLESVKREKGKLVKDLSDTQSRLSKLMGDKLSDNNPDIADLSDNNRPTKLAEQYQELYDNLWTDAYEVAEEYFSDKQENYRISQLLKILMKTYRYCEQEIANQDNELMQAMYRTDVMKKTSGDLPATVKTQLKEIKRFAATEAFTNLNRKYIKDIDETTSFGAFSLKVNGFVHECLHLCWLMVRQDPPLVLHLNVQKNEDFDSNRYKHYTVTGKVIDFVVWPALLLHLNGPVLCKGVAQCRKSLQGSKSVRVRSREVTASQMGIPTGEVTASQMGIPTGSVRLTGNNNPVDTATWLQDKSTGSQRNEFTVDDKPTKSAKVFEEKNTSSDTKATASGIQQTEQSLYQNTTQLRDLTQNRDHASGMPNYRMNQPPLKPFRSEAHVQLTHNQHEGLPTQLENITLQQHQPIAGNYQDNQYTFNSYHKNPTTSSSYNQHESPAAQYPKNVPVERSVQQSQSTVSTDIWNQSQSSTQLSPSNYYQKQTSYSQYPQALSTTDEAANQQQPVERNSHTNISYPPHLIPTQDELNTFVNFNNWYGTDARRYMGEQLYVKCMNYLAWYNPNRNV